jgi:crotonobetainyl-CoA:carnitine CoA-transferase CaiB-like acyl-CoA transferase
MAEGPAQGNKAGLRPLDQILVVSLEQAIAAPLCTRHLADLGARVIKVERPGRGDFARDYDQRARGMASHFVWVNRSKESLALDLKNPAHLQVLRALVARADVLVQNLVPGATARMGLDAATLRQGRPELIVCDISGYGQDGPYRDRKAYDLLIQGESGLISVTGSADAPAKAGNSMADIAAGMYAYSAILAALMQRQRTGQGSHIDVSMLESLVEWMGYPMYYAMDGAPPPARTGASHATIQPYGPYATGDGVAVILGVQNEREWLRFCAQVLGRPELATDSRFDTVAKRGEHVQALNDLILQAFSQLDIGQVERRLDEAQIAHARMNSMADVWAHPQLRARQRWTTVESPSGLLPTLKPPASQSAFEPRLGPIPGVGQHNEAILKELGMQL